MITVTLLSKFPTCEQIRYNRKLTFLLTPNVDSPPQFIEREHLKLFCFALTAKLLLKCFFLSSIQEISHERRNCEYFLRSLKDLTFAEMK